MKRAHPASYVDQITDWMLVVMVLRIAAVLVVGAFAIGFLLAAVR